jgi:hypothetical protein
MDTDQCIKHNLPHLCPIETVCPEDEHDDYDEIQPHYQAVEVGTDHEFKAADEGWSTRKAFQY